MRLSILDSCKLFGLFPSGFSGCLLDYRLIEKGGHIYKNSFVGCWVEWIV